MIVKRTVEVAKPLAEVFAYLADFENTTHWDPGTIETKRVSGDGGVGSVYRNRSQFNGRETQLEYTVKDYVQDQRIVLQGVNATVTAVDTMEFRATATGTEVTYTADFTFKGIARIAVPFLGGAFRRLGDEAAAGLRKAFAG